MPLFPGMPPGMLGQGRPGMPPGGQMPQGGPPPGMPPGGQMPPGGPGGQPIPPELLQQLLGPGGPGGPGGQPPMPEKLSPEGGLNPEENAALELALGDPDVRKMLASFALELLGGKDEKGAGGMPGPSGRRDAEPGSSGSGGLGAFLGG